MEPASGCVRRRDFQALAERQTAAAEMFARGKRQAAALVKGPRANAFPTEMWTLAQVAEVIETVTGVRYSQTQTWTILREPLGVEPAASGAAGDRA